MVPTISILIALALPTPYRTAPPPRFHPATTHSPTYGTDPIKVARFHTYDFMTHKSQMTAQEQGRKLHEAYLAQVNRGRGTVVTQGQITSGTNVNYTVTTPPASLYATPAPFYPSFVHSR